jgi:hypothetical protein
MGIMEHFKSKKNEQLDIVTSLDNTIKQLQEYLGQLKSGQIHNIEKYEGSRNGEFAESMIQQEIVMVSNAIAPLKAARSAITRGRIAEQHFHYDLDGRSMGDEC